GGGARRSRARIGGEMGLGLVAPEISGEGEGGGGWSAAVGRRKKGGEVRRRRENRGVWGWGFAVVLGGVSPEIEDGVGFRRW
ncbi:hypothetical protein SOVF_128610, partial [Spinacia oleracea]